MFLRTWRRTLPQPTCSSHEHHQRRLFYQGAILLHNEAAIGMAQASLGTKTAARQGRNYLNDEVYFKMCKWFMLKSCEGSLILRTKTPYYWEKSRASQRRKKVSMTGTLRAFSVTALRDRLHHPVKKKDLTWTFRRGSQCNLGASGCCLLD